MSLLDGFTAHRRRNGFSTHSCGFSGDFSWMRSTANHFEWFVCGLGQFCGSGKAVMDDYGTLVEVK